MVLCREHGLHITDIHLRGLLEIFHGQFVKVLLGLQDLTACVERFQERGCPVVSIHLLAVVVCHGVGGSEIFVRFIW